MMSEASVEAVSVGGDGLRKALQFFLKYGILVLFSLLVVILAITSKNFLSIANVTNVLLQTSVIGVIAIGMTFVIITGGIDVSVGSVVAIASAAGVGLIKFMGAPWWLGMLCIVLVGIVFGLINGVSVTYLRMPAFLVTLSTMGIGRGLTLVMSGGRSWHALPPQFGAISTTTIAGFPVMIPAVVVMYVLSYVVLQRTAYGRKLFALGGNKESARVSGISVKRIEMVAYVVCGSLAGVAAIFQTARLNSFWAAMGTGFEFQAIAAVVIGGTSLAGGIGTTWGTLMGVLLMGVINNALNLWGIPANWQDVARGTIIFIAVMLDALRTRYLRTEA